MGWSKKRVFGAVCSFTVGSLLFASGAQESGGAATGGLGPIGFQKTGLPIVSQTVILKVMAQRDVFHKKEFADFQLVKDMEKLTNVQIQWDLVPSNAWLERVNLAFASNDLPDIFFRTISKSMQLQYGEQGLLLPLNDLVKQYAPNLQKYYAKYPSLVPAATGPSGKMYALPGRSVWGFSANPDTLLINNEWLKKLGLAVPTTIEEFEAVLRAFKTRDPNGNGKNDEIPFSFRWGDSTQGVSSLFGLFGLLDYPNNHMIVQDKKVQFTAAKSQYREALEWFSRLYREGLIDQEALVQDVKQYTAKGKDMLYGVFMDWSGVNIVGAPAMLNETYVAVPPMKGKTGQRIWRYNDADVMHGEAAISRSAKYPEVAMRWIDAISDPLVNMQWSDGPIGVRYRMENNRIVENAAPAGISGGEFRHSEAPGRSSPLLWTPDFVDIVPNAATALKFKFVKMNEPFFSPQYYPDVFFNLQESEELSTLGTDIGGLVLQKQAVWVMDGNIGTEWDAYLKVLDQMGLPKYVAIHQAAYDRYMKGR